MAYVYQHTRLDINEVFYIGVGGIYNHDNFQRAYSKASRSKFWRNIVRKAEYKVDILFDFLSKEDALKKETELITQLGRRDLNKGCLVNLTDGGEGSTNVKVSKETVLKRQPKISGENAYWYGKKMTTEQRELLSKAKLGKKRTVETTTEWCTKIALKKLQHYILQYDREGTLLNVYLGYGDVERAGFVRSNVSMCCSGKRNNHRNFIWKHGERINKEDIEKFYSFETTIPEQTRQLILEQYLKIKNG